MVRFVGSGTDACEPVPTPKCLPKFDFHTSKSSMSISSFRCRRPRGRSQLSKWVPPHGVVGRIENAVVVVVTWQRVLGNLYLEQVGIKGSCAVISTSTGI
jgi:hypothetical protein